MRQGTPYGKMPLEGWVGSATPTRTRSAVELAGLGRSSVEGVLDVDREHAFLRCPPNRGCSFAHNALVAKDGAARNRSSATHRV